MRYLTFLLLILLFAGCRSQEGLTENGDQTDMQESIEGTWELRELNNEPVDISQFRDQLPYINITDDSNRFSGFGGCNQLGGDMELDRETGQISFINITATRMHCGDDNPEPELMQILQQTDHFSISGTSLELTGADGSTLLFERTEG